jgi:hypothetical protein
LKGQLTIAAENNIVVTWHVDYQNGVSGNDLLGLVANNNVEVYHPVRKQNNNYTNSNVSALPVPSGYPTYAGHGAVFTNSRINAAILSVNHSFRVQTYDRGSQLGNLNVTGAIAQRYRGIVGLIGSTGFNKNYVYDLRLKYLSPPKFLDPVASAWAVAVWSEIKVPAGL